MTHKGWCASCPDIYACSLYCLMTFVKHLHKHIPAHKHDKNACHSASDSVDFTYFLEDSVHSHAFFFYLCHLTLVSHTV